MNHLDSARTALSRAAIRSRQRHDGPPRTSRAALADWARAHIGDRPLLVVSNREPWSHVHRNGAVQTVRNAGGLTVALDAVMQALGGVWIAQGSGDADRCSVDAADHVGCPPGRPRYQLRRLWLSPEENAGYYGASGFGVGDFIGAGKLTRC